MGSSKLWRGHSILLKACLKHPKLLHSVCDESFSNLAVICSKLDVIIVKELGVGCLFRRPVRSLINQRMLQLHYQVLYNVMVVLRIF